MRLLKQNDKGGFDFFEEEDDRVPPYAILSHTWGDFQHRPEVLYHEMLDGTAEQKESFAKIKFIAKEAKARGLEYFWVDNCCINKRDTAELSAALNSMYRWYENAAWCFVYLSDVSMNKRDHNGNPAWDNSFRACRWFTRGWTLQELVAPTKVDFFARDHHLGNRIQLCEQIYEATGIPEEILKGTKTSRELSVYTRYKWARVRETTKGEDAAYCMMGLCEVFMPINYGEGKSKAWGRLEEEVRKRHPSFYLDGGETESEGVPSWLLEQRQRRLQTLRFDMIGFRHDNIDTSVGQTCKWISQHQKFTEWMDFETSREDAGFLWIRGIPGAGKSVLMKHVNTHISETKDVRDVCVSFYFNARGDDLEKSLEGMYRSLVLQLLQAVPTLQHLLDRIEPITESPAVTLRNLRRTFEDTVLELQNRRVYCLIDALDECSEEDMQHMIDSLVTLSKKANEKGILYKVCLASRYYPTLHIYTSLYLDLQSVDAHTTDLKEYVETQTFANGDHGKPQPIPDAIRRKILDKAKGVFLWIKLVIKILQKEFRRANFDVVERVLDQIPRDLSELYKRIVQRDQENVEDFLLCLDWVLLAQRTLQPDELYFAMMAASDNKSLARNSRHTRRAMVTFVRDSSKGLVELTKQRPSRVQFIHESVRDFLIREKGYTYIDPNYDFTFTQAHETLKRCCIRMIKLNPCKTMPAIASTQKGMVACMENLERRKELCATYPFLKHAFAWSFHYANQAAAASSQWDFIQLLLQESIADWREIVNMSRDGHNQFSQSVDLAYILATGDYGYLLKELVDHDVELNLASSERFRSPLLAALANGSSHAARALLAKEGASDPSLVVDEILIENNKARASFVIPRTKTRLLWAIEQGYESLALHTLRQNLLEPLDKRPRSLKLLRAASIKGQSEVVKLLLARGISAPSKEYLHTIRMAVQHQQAPVAELLARHGLETWQPRAKSDHCATLLQEALHARIDEAADVLIDQGADVTAIGKFTSGNAIQLASDAGYSHIVEKLIRKGADVNAQGWSFGTCLSAAAGNGHAEVVKLLIRHGADVNFGRETNRYPLIRASCAYRIETAKLLIDSGADVNAPGGSNGPALQAAAVGYVVERTHPHVMGMIQLLLRRGADPNASGGRAGSALIAASHAGEIQIMKLLLENGANVHAEGNEYGTALQAAAINQRAEAVKMLIEEHGADINQEGGYYGTALQAAAAACRPNCEMAVLLISYGAELTTRGGRYGSPMRAAKAKGQDQIARLLRELGVTEDDWSDGRMASISDSD